MPVRRRRKHQGLISRTLSLLLVATVAACAFAGSDGDPAQRQADSAGSAQAIGFYSAGCLSRGAELPLEDRGLQVMRPSRGRYFAHPQTVAVVRTLGRRAASLGRRLLIGDLSQVNGGRMPFGHVSHQSGLDADIWFHSLAASEQLTRKQTETIAMRSMVDKSAGQLKRERWSAFNESMLEHAAKSPHVQRIFVNPVIKQALCRDNPQRTWLAKLRPWWGHDAHFHVRLACPDSSANCEAQQPPPPGTGCDRDLDRWVEDQRNPPKRPTAKKTRKPRRLPPEACRRLVGAGSGMN